MFKNIKTLGILGAGQLGRMSAQAAKKLGIDVVLYDPNDKSPGFEVATDYIFAPWDNEPALTEFANKVDVISYEFENIPVKTIEFVSELKSVYPKSNLLEIAQHRIKEKTYLNDIGIKTTRFAHASTPGDVTRTLEAWGEVSCILKTCRFGYDGKGQVFYNKTEDDLELAWKKLGSDDIIIEGVIDFDYEISVVVAADQFGTIKTYSPVLNEHKNHILHKTISPAPVSQEIANTAISYATKLAKDVELIGVLALELFVTKSGEVLANEIAPRTHNSGHWSIDGAKTSQFENHVRGVCNLPLGDTDIIMPTEMVNLIGNDIDDLSMYENNSNARIHLYGKDEARPGRKMGHVTILKD